MDVVATKVATQTMQSTSRWFHKIENKMSIFKKKELMDQEKNG